jgi:hypothetical protein
MVEQEDIRPAYGTNVEDERTTGWSRVELPLIGAAPWSMLKVCWEDRGLRPVALLACGTSRMVTVMSGPSGGSVAVVVEGSTVQLAIASSDHASVVVLDVEQAVTLLDDLRGACVEAWENRLRFAGPSDASANDD